jgi:hypothetical protein
MNRPIVFCALLVVSMLGCDQSKQDRTVLNDRATSAEKPSSGAPEISNDARRYAFPSSSKPFSDASVALDTMTGQLCKTYPWEDDSRLPRGLQLCSTLSSGNESASVGSHRIYRGFTYTFDGSKWIKGGEALKYTAAGVQHGIWSDDQYDPLGIYSKEEKAKRSLSEEQIRKVAQQFGVSYDDAWDDAKSQGYRVPGKH